MGSRQYRSILDRSILGFCGSDRRVPDWGWGMQPNQALNAAWDLAPKVSALSVVQ